jgi:hypothetical protein
MRAVRRIETKGGTTRPVAVEAGRQTSGITARAAGLRPLRRVIDAHGRQATELPHPMQIAKSPRCTHQRPRTGRVRMMHKRHGSLVYVGDRPERAAASRRRR